MKKLLVGAIVGGLIIFIWQTLSWTAFNLHQSSQQYTPKQDSILAYLRTQFSETGGYLLPTVLPNATMHDMDKLSAVATGKPWVQIYYHKAFHVNILKNMGMGLLADILMAGLVCWIFLKFRIITFTSTFTNCLFIGLATFIAVPLTNHIWYEWVDLKMYFIDAVVSWAMCGLWFGWWLTGKRKIRG